jgi:nitrate reductase cytochrome c-type subunit
VSSTGASGWHTTGAAKQAMANKRMRKADFISLRQTSRDRQTHSSQLQPPSVPLLNKSIETMQITFSDNNNRCFWLGRMLYRLTMGLAIFAGDSTNLIAGSDVPGDDLGQ